VCLSGRGEYTTRLARDADGARTVSAAHDASQRLVRLADILNAAGISRVWSTTDAADPQLRSITLERIRRLTAELRQRSGQEPDDIDRVVTRLLLDEYAEAVAHLRAVARAAAERIDEAPRTIKDVGLYVHRRMKVERRERLREEKARLYRERKHLRSGVDAPPAPQPSKSR